MRALWLKMLCCVQELMPGSSAEHGISAKGSSSSQLKSWLSGLGKKGKAETDEVRSLRYMHNGLIESIL